MATEPWPLSSVWNSPQVFQCYSESKNQGQSEGRISIHTVIPQIFAECRPLTGQSWGSVARREQLSCPGPLLPSHLKTGAGCSLAPLSRWRVGRQGCLDDLGCELSPLDGGAGRALGSMCVTPCQGGGGSFCQECSRGAGSCRRRPDASSLINWEEHLSQCATCLSCPGSPCLRNRN